MNAKLKILTINSARKFTGEAAHSLDLTEQLILRGHKVLLAVRSPGKMYDRAVERQVPIHLQLKFSGGIHCTLDDLRKLRKLIRQEQPDIIHCHRGNDHGLAVAAVAGMRNRPAIVRTRHRVMPVRNTVSNRWLFARGTDMTIAVSEKAAASFGQMRQLLNETLRVVYSSVDTEKFTQARRSTEWRRSVGVADDEPLIGLIARLQRVKGQEQFLRAAARVLEEFPKAKFMVAGIGQVHKRPKLEQMAKQLKIHDRVLFLDWLNDVPATTASLDVGVLASLGSEGSSRVTYEYMASGTAVVATSVGCIPEIVDNGNTGYVVAPGDVSAMANAVKSLLKNPAARKQMADRALQYALEKHSRKRWVDDVLAVYAEALQGRDNRKGVGEAVKSYGRIFKSRKQPAK